MDTQAASLPPQHVPWENRAANGKRAHRDLPYGPAALPWGTSQHTPGGVAAMEPLLCLVVGGQK